jgi:hypothetical protein
MIEIVQRILDDMKDEAPPSATVITEARARYQKMLNGDDDDDDDGDDDDYDDDGYDDGDDGNDGNGAATLKRGSSTNSKRLAVPPGPPGGGSGSIFSWPSGSSSGSYSMFSLRGGRQYFADDPSSLGPRLLPFPAEPFPPLPPLQPLPSTVVHSLRSRARGGRRGSRRKVTASTGVIHYGQGEDEDEEQSPKKKKKRRQK